jgi:hypothetical protein
MDADCFQRRPVRPTPGTSQATARFEYSFHEVWFQMGAGWVLLWVQYGLEHWDVLVLRLAKI